MALAVPAGPAPTTTTARSSTDIRRGDPQVISPSRAPPNEREGDIGRAGGDIQEGDRCFPWNVHEKLREMTQHNRCAAREAIHPPDIAQIVRECGGGHGAGCI